MTLTPDNYHAPEQNAAYMSVSAYKQWTRCAARYAAILRGDWQDEDKEAFALGRYVDTALLTPDRLDKMIADDADAFTYRGKPRAFVGRGDEMVTRAKRDPFFMSSLAGEPQRVITFDLFGVKWKAMLDVVNFERGYLTDLKTCRSIDDLEWSDELKAKVPFYQTYNYWLQIAVYREAFKSVAGAYPKTCFISAISKQDPPDIRVIEFTTEGAFEQELREIKANLPRIIQMRDQFGARTRCDRCDYCRATRVLRQPEVAQYFKVGAISEADFAA